MNITLSIDEKILKKVHKIVVDKIPRCRRRRTDFIPTRGPTPRTFLTRRGAQRLIRPKCPNVLPRIVYAHIVQVG